MEGEVPRPWAVATLWLTFLGAAVAATGFLFGRFILAGISVSPAAARRRTGAIVAAAAVALLATLAEPVLQVWSPTPGAVPPSLGEAITGLPPAWWLRPLGLAATLALGVVLLVTIRRGRHPQAAEVAGALVALLALLGLALTSHASARPTWQVIAVPAIVIHEWAVALWAGGLVQLALTWPRR